jgi:hypothetical protein
MRFPRFVLAGLALACLCPSTGAAAQSPASCPDQISIAQLPGPFSGTIEFEGYDFRVPVWSREADASPNSSYYVPADPTNLDPLDVTTTKRWLNATMLLACYEGNVPIPYLLVRVLRKIGTLVNASAVCGEDPTSLTSPPDGTSGGDGTTSPPMGCGGSDGGGGPTGSGCSVQYVYVEMYNDVTGMWDVIWEGYATVC